MYALIFTNKTKGLFFLFDVNGHEEVFQLLLLIPPIHFTKHFSINKSKWRPSKIRLKVCALGFCVAMASGL
jgi:hypothetical protein